MSRAVILLGVRTPIGRRDGALSGVRPDDLAATVIAAAVARAGVPPEEILLIDDSRPNVMAAGQQGWKVMWFDDFRPEESVARVRSSLELS